MAEVYGATKYSDGGHGWLRVDRKMLARLGVAAEVSTCSYERAEEVYLEEDCDAPLFIRAMEAAGYSVAVREVRTADGDSFVRGLRHFRA
jgi:hypothetical protein